MCCRGRGVSDSHEDSHCNGLRSTAGQCHDSAACYMGTANSFTVWWSGHCPMFAAGHRWMLLIVPDDMHICATDSMQLRLATPVMGRPTGMR